jgi:4-amino-4-deoxy-L-arabinose transferase-like glycosyltransferase
MAAYLKNYCLNRPFVPLAVIVSFALALRLIFFVGLGFNDDSYYLQFAETIFKGLPFHPTRYVWSVRIGIYLPVVLFWKMFGISEYSTALFFLLCSLGSVIAVYGIGKQLFSTATGLIAACLLSIFPLDIIYATQVGPEVPFSLFACLSILWFLKAYGADRRYRFYGLLSGAGLGVANLFKETFILVPVCCAAYVICDLFAGMRRGPWRSRMQFFISFFNKKIIIICFFFCCGFAVVHQVQNLYLHQLTGEWFFAEKAKAWTLTNDKNRNDDFKLYPMALLNADKNRFEWIHNKPFFGFTYWAVLAGILVLALRRQFSRQTFFVLTWLLVFFFFFQYGLHVVATVLADDGMRPRHIRFLMSMSAPAALLIACACTMGPRARDWFSLLLLLFLLTTSLYYTRQCKTFLRNGMGYVRETVQYLQSAGKKTVYIPDNWSLSKFSFFAGYDDAFIDNLEVYECSRINCSDKYYDRGEYIKDAYVVTFVNPYTYINSRNAGQKIYPAFMSSPPAYWQLVKTIELPNFGIFNKFKPRIYYAP